MKTLHNNVSWCKLTLLQKQGIAGDITKINDTFNVMKMRKMSD